MSQPFIGEVRAFAFGFVPKGWFPCDGRKLPISKHTALFTLLGTRFGGDGSNDFALPDMSGRAVIGAGTPPGGGKIVVGEFLGTSGVVLDSMSLAKHSHTLRKKVTNAPLPVSKTSAPSAVSDLGGLSDAMGTVGYKSAITATPVPDVVLDPITVGWAGNPMPAAHENRQPYLAVTYAIADTGVFPPHS